MTVTWPRPMSMSHSTASTEPTWRATTTRRVLGGEVPAAPLPSVGAFGGDVFERDRAACNTHGRTGTTSVTSEIIGGMFPAPPRVRSIA